MTTTINSDLDNNRVSQLPLHVVQATMQCITSSQITTGPFNCIEPTVGGNARAYVQIQPKVLNPNPVRSRNRHASPFRPWVGPLRTFKVLIHVLSFRNDRGRVPANGLEVSHLCANTRCFNPNHLVEESHLQNMDRQRCAGVCRIRYQCESCGINQVFDRIVCQHNPQCLIITNI